MVGLLLLVEEPQQSGFCARPDPSSRVRPEQMLLARGEHGHRRLQSRRRLDISLRSVNEEKIHATFLINR